MFVQYKLGAFVKSDEQNKLLLERLDKWIEILNNPVSFQRKYLKRLLEIRNLIADDASLNKNLLVDGNIWGGMGSFIDNAISEFSSLLPKSNNPAIRAKEWESANIICDQWYRKKEQATIELGEIVLEVCDLDGSIERWERNMILARINSCKLSLNTPYRPLEPYNIQNLERLYGAS